MGNPGTISIGSGSKCLDLESFLLRMHPALGGAGRQRCHALDDFCQWLSGGDTMVGEQPFDYGQPVSLMFEIEVWVLELTSISKTRSRLRCSSQTSARTTITSASPM
jgi:hypothetical protein